MLAMRRSDLESCLAAVHAIGAASTGGDGFARGGVSALRRLVPSDLTTLSICDLDTGHRSVVSDVPDAISKDGIAAFDREIPPIARRAHDREARVLAGLALAVTALFAWLAWDARIDVRRLEGSAGGRIAQLGAESAQARAALTTVQATLREAQARIAELEARAADTQEQRVAQIGRAHV